MNNSSTLREDDRYTRAWAAVLVASLLLVMGFFAIRAWQDRAHFIVLADAIAHRQRFLAQRPAINQRLTALHQVIRKARTLGVTAPMTNLAVSAVQTQIATQITQQGATVTLINTFATDTGGLRLAHVTLTATVPLARLQPLLNALAALPWAVRVTHLTIHHIRKGTAEIRLGLTVPIFRTMT